MRSVEELKDLVQRARSGEVDAYARIVHRFQDMAVGYAYGVLGDFHLAEDAAQEAFVEGYRHLDELREPAAFPGWFRRIVFKQCDRILRRRRLAGRSLDAVAESAAPTPEPGPAAERREMRDAVLKAICELPEHERMVTTLFYINGYSQKDIADFLEAPVTTVNSRLRAARRRLKERMTHMVDETLKANAPDERFSRRVIETLLARPKLLEIEGHPVRQVWEEMRRAMPEYELVAGNEIENLETFSAAQDNALESAYRPADDKVLRYQMTSVTMSAIRGRKPPLKLLAVGRCFRPDREDATHAKVFHQLDGVRIETGLDVGEYKRTCEQILRASLPEAKIEWHDYEYALVSPGFTAIVTAGKTRLEALGGGMLTSDALRKAGFDPDAVSGFAWGLSLERIAMMKLGIDDIRKLWQPPFVPTPR